MPSTQRHRPDRNLEVVSRGWKSSRVEGYDHLRLGGTAEVFPVLPIRVIQTASAICPECGGRLIPNGSCRGCVVCGWGACE